MNPTNSMATLLGGVDIVVSKLDGTQEPVKVRQLPVKEMPAYAEALEDELILVELVCGKPKGWAETITRESHMAIIEADEKVNADFFSQWTARRVKRMEAVLPGSVEKLLNSVSPDGLQK